MKHTVKNTRGRALFRRLVALLLLPGWEKEPFLVRLSCLLFLPAVFFRMYPLVVLSLLLMSSVRIGYMWDKAMIHLRIRSLRSRKAEIIERGKNGYICLLDDLGLSEGTRALVDKELAAKSEVEMGEIDMDGFLRSRFGPLPGSADLGKREFSTRKRASLSVIVIGGKVGVKKKFGSDRKGFAREVEALDALAGRCNVPAIIDVDFENLTAVFSYIQGKVVREELAKKGAVVRNRDVETRREFMSLGGEERKRRRMEEGKRLLHEVMSDEQISCAFEELRKMHKEGVCHNDIKYGNILLEEETGDPFFLDFELSFTMGKSRGIFWEARRDADIEMFNRHFNRDYPTLSRLEESLA